MQPIPFDRKNHTYKSAAFVELVKDVIRFFNGTPVYPLSPSENFQGSGVYALYYNRCNGIPRSEVSIFSKIEEHLQKMGDQ
jgi:hypothetical protein